MFSDSRKVARDLGFFVRMSIFHKIPVSVVHLAFTIEQFNAYVWTKISSESEIRFMNF